MFWVDRGLAVEEGITCRQRLGPGRPVDADRRKRPVVAHADNPAAQQHARQVTDMVGMKVGEEHASRREMSSPGSTKADGAPRPQSITKIRPPMTNAEQIPRVRRQAGVRPPFPAVPVRSSCSSALCCCPASSTSVAIRPARPGGGLRLTPSGEAMPVKSTPRGMRVSPIRAMRGHPGMDAFSILLLSL